MIIAALGVVFGDIGTSPIYTLQTVFNPGDPHPVPVARHNVYGVVSLIFWSVMIIVTLTYITLVMRADNNGEGGIMALITLLRRWTGAAGRRTAVMLAGAGHVRRRTVLRRQHDHPGDLGAVGGRGRSRSSTPASRTWIVPITAVIIVGLFSVQRRGTAAVGRFFGPVMIAVVHWRSARAGSTASSTTRRSSRRCRRPTRWRSSPATSTSPSSRSPRSCSRSPARRRCTPTWGTSAASAITFGWLGLVLPACTLSYFGQGALVLSDESTVAAPFFLLTPEWARIPMVLLATAATVIASQAVITGAFSVASQAAQLGYLPRLRIEHTSASTIGQIYVPWINGALMVAVLILVFAFRSSAALAYAFGMAVTGTITITTHAVPLLRQDAVGVAAVGGAARRRRCC